MSYLPPKASPSHHKPEILGLNLATMMALRSLYLTLGGDFPITPQSVTRISADWIAREARSNPLRPGQIIELNPGEPLPMMALPAPIEPPQAEMIVAHMAIRPDPNDTTRVILRDTQLGEAGSFPASEVAQALANYFWLKF